VAHPECSERRPECGPCYGLAGEIGLPQRQEGTSWAGKCRKNVGHADSLNGWPGTGRHDGQEIGDAGWWAVEPNVGRVVNGLAARVDRLTALGNGQVPACAAEAYRRLSLYR
jgi:DNA (cytosine-5)-methyltransferase 1